MGEQKLTELASDLEKHRTINDQPIPSEILLNFPVPSATAIPTIPVVSASTVKTATGAAAQNEVQKHLSRSATPAPFLIQCDQIKSAMIELNVLLDTHSLSDELRVYLELYLVRHRARGF